MHLSVGDVLRRLAAEGHATASADDAARDALRGEMDTHLPWFLRIAVGLGAWVATGFLLGFLVAVAQLDDAIVRILVGAALVAGAVYLRHVSVSEFRKHAAVAVSLAGQALIIAGIFEFTDSPRIAALAVVGLSTGLIVVFRDSLHRFLSTLAAIGGAYVALMAVRGVPGFEIVTMLVIVAAALVWRFRLSSRPDALGDILLPVGYALVVGMFAALLADTLTHFRDMSLDAGTPLRLSRATSGLLMLAASALAFTVVDELGADRRAAFGAISAALLLGLGTLSTPGIIAAAAVLALAFDRRDRVLLGMGIVFLLAFGSVYYYSLDLTLAEKAAALAGSGVLLLVVRHALMRA